MKGPQGKNIGNVIIRVTLTHTFSSLVFLCVCVFAATFGQCKEGQADNK